MLSFFGRWLKRFLVVVVLFTIFGGGRSLMHKISSSAAGGGFFGNGGPAPQYTPPPTTAPCLNPVGEQESCAKLALFGPNNSDYLGWRVCADAEGSVPVGEPIYLSVVDIDHGYVGVRASGGTLKLVSETQIAQVPSLSGGVSQTSTVSPVSTSATSIVLANALSMNDTSVNTYAEVVWTPTASGQSVSLFDTRTNQVLQDQVVKSPTLVKSQVIPSQGMTKGAIYDAISCGGNG